MGSTSSLDPVTTPFESGMPGLVLHLATLWWGTLIGVTSVAYSPDGRHIISGSTDNTIRIWDAETGAAVGGPLQGHTDVVRSVACSPNGRHIISGSDDMTIRIWDAESGAAVMSPLEGHTEYTIRCLLSQWATHHLWL
jgi:WD40 repeat protein